MRRTRLSDRWGFAVGVIMAGQLALTTASGQCVPAIVGSTDGPCCARDVAVSGSLAYVAVGESGLHVIDVADPANPTLIGSVAAGDVRAVAVSGTLAYVLEGNRLKVIDVSIPTAPTIIGDVEAPLWVSLGVAVSGGFAYVGGKFGFDSGRLVVVDVSVPTNPTVTGFAEIDMGWFEDVAVSGSVAYAVGDGLSVIDVSDPEAPMIIGTVDGFQAFSIEVSGNLAYVTGIGARTALFVIDVSDPANPTIIGSVAAPIDFAVQKVAVSGGEAYLSDTRSGLLVIDVSLPASPTILGSVATPSAAQGVAVAGDLAYVGTSGLQVIEISTCDRGACCLIEGCLELTPATCASVSGTYLGDESTCAASSCPLLCPADLSGNGAVDFADILSVIMDWGPCP